jgi:hypothetical protein
MAKLHLKKTYSFLKYISKQKFQEMKLRKKILFKRESEGAEKIESIKSRLRESILFLCFYTVPRIEK